MQGDISLARWDLRDDDGESGFGQRDIERRSKRVGIAHVDALVAERPRHDGEVVVSRRPKEEFEAFAVDNEPLRAEDLCLDGPHLTNVPPPQNGVLEMYIGGGTVVLILVIVLIVFLVRR